MNFAKTMNLEEALRKNVPVHVVYEYSTKEIVAWYPFGKKLAELDAENRCNRNGPDTYSFAIWEHYVNIRERHQKHLEQLEEIERRL